MSTVNYYAAPSAPRDVTVTLIAPQVVEVRWMVPASPNGVITHYTVYAIPSLPADHPVDGMPQTIKTVGLN